MHFGVIGAGIVGLTTALQLQEEFPTSRISIIADKFLADTTSHVAAGIFRPGTSFSGPTEEITRQWVSDAYNYWDAIRVKPEAPLAGVCRLSGYIFSSHGKAQVKNHLLEKILPVYRSATEDEFSLCHGDWKYGSFFTTLLTESSLFMPYSTEKFKRNGGKVFEKHINSFNELEGKFDIIFNCAGLGAQELCTDYKLIPIRGQVIKVRAPWLKLAFYGDYDTYIIPGFEGVTLGGSRHYDSYSTKLCKYDSESILERCVSMLPALKQAPTIREAIGLRPHRSQVRVDTELFTTTSNGKIKIIHNYGHGGYGITTAPGTAKYAVKLAREIHSANSSFSKL